MTIRNKNVTVQYTLRLQRLQDSPIKKTLGCKLEKGPQLGPGEENQPAASPTLSFYESKYIHSQK
jgi:hypothetical protein